jgi:hypothetical protein
VPSFKGNDTGGIIAYPLAMRPMPARRDHRPRQGGEIPGRNPITAAVLCLPLGALWRC